MTRLLVIALLILTVTSCLPGDRYGSPTPVTPPPIPSDRPLPTTTIEVPPPI